MAAKDQEYRLFVGGLSWEVTERQLEDAFSRFGKILDCQIMLERDTGRPRGFGFLTFADRRSMEDAIRDMDGRELGERAITVNKAQPRMGGEDSDFGYAGSYSSGGGGGGGGGRGGGGFGRGSRGGGGEDDCFKCGRPGHWARDCPSSGGGRGGRPLSPRPRYGGGRGDRYRGDRDRYVDDRYETGRYGDRDRYESRDVRYGSRDRFVSDRYPPPTSADRFGADRYGVSDRYPTNSYGKDKVYDRDGGPRGGAERYGGGGGPTRYEGRSYRERPGPYDNPNPRRGGRPSAFDRY